MKSKTTWILIADGARARLLCKNRAGGKYESVTAADFIADRRPGHDIETDRPGRTHDRMGDQRHALEPTSDPHREEKRALARRIGNFLEEERQKKAFERLVLIAAPQALGDLRESFTPALKNLVAEEIDKDLTMFTLHELQDRLDRLIQIVL